MNICVTGSNGFIGKAIVGRLKQEGHNVIPFDLPECDLMLPETYPDCDIDIVIHAAAIANLNESAKDLELNFAINVVGTYMISDWCCTLNAKLLYVSTCCAWGKAKWPCVEDFTCPLPTEPYAHSKLAGEYAIKSSPLTNYMIYRIGTVYGPGMREALFNYQAIDKIAREKLIELHDGGEQRRQYIYIDDLVDAFVIGVKWWKNQKTFSICGTERISVIDSVMTAADILEKEPITEHVKGREEENFDQFVSLTNSERVLKWKPKTTFYEGMKKTVKWYMENKID